MSMSFMVSPSPCAKAELDRNARVVTDAKTHEIVKRIFWLVSGCSGTQVRFLLVTRRGVAEGKGELIELANRCGSSTKYVKASQKQHQRKVSGKSSRVVFATRDVPPSYRCGWGSISIWNARSKSTMCGRNRGMIRWGGRLRIVAKGPDQTRLSPQSEITNQFPPNFHQGRKAESSVDQGLELGLNRLIRRAFSRVMTATVSGVAGVSVLWEISGFAKCGLNKHPTTSNRLSYSVPQTDATR